MNDILDITLGVNFLSRVCTIHSKFRILRNFEGETLTVRDMPVESVELSSLSMTAT